MAHSRILAIIRHAHAGPGQGDDHARALSARGCSQASAAGAWLEQQAFAPQQLLHSDALRTTQSAELIAEALTAAPPCTALRELYLAPPQRVMRATQHLDPDHGCAAIVAHNPGLAELAAMLARRAGPGGSDLVAFVPATVAVFRFEGDWADIEGAQTELIAHWRPS